MDVDVLTRLLNHLTDGKSARNFSASDEEKEIISNLFLLSAKPVIYAANISESDLGKNERDLPLVKEVEKIAEAEGSQVLVICAKVEEELSALPPEEQESTRKNLLKYCELDTFAMVKIWQELERLVNE